MNNEFKVGDLVTMLPGGAFLMRTVRPEAGFITEFSTPTSGRLVKVMWTDGQHYFYQS